MQSCDTLRCPKCKGTGRISIAMLSKPFRDCLNAIRKLGRPTMLEIHALSGNGLLPTATNKRVSRLAAEGFVRIIDDQKAYRVEVVDPEENHRPASLKSPPRSSASSPRR